MIEQVKRFLQEQQLPIEWLAIQSGLSKRTVIALLDGKLRMTPKYAARLQQALTRKNV